MILPAPRPACCDDERERKAGRKTSRVLDGTGGPYNGPTFNGRPGTEPRWNHKDRSAPGRSVAVRGYADADSRTVCNCASKGASSKSAAAASTPAIANP